jgi:hypothetical protein
MLRRGALVGTDVSEDLWALLLFLRSVRRLLVTGGVVHSSPTLVTLMKEALSSSETSVLTRATRRNILEHAVLRSHLRENLKSYIENTMFRELDLFPSSGEWRKTHILLGPIERAKAGCPVMEASSF